MTRCIVSARYDLNTFLSGKKRADMKCTSCGVSVDVDNIWVAFECPGCSKERIVRCSRCKKLINKYKCPGCGFSGP